MRRRLLPLLLVPLTGFVFAGLARAESPTPIEVDVQIVHASNAIQPAKVDPECESLRKKLPMDFAHLEMKQRKRLSLAFGQSGRLMLPSGRAMNFVPISIVQDRLHLHFQIERMVDTRLQLKNGKEVIVGGEAYDRGRIIVMVRPSFALPARTPDAPPPSGPQLHRVGHSD